MSISTELATLSTPCSNELSTVLFNKEANAFYKKVEVDKVQALFDAYQKHKADMVSWCEMAKSGKIGGLNYLAKANLDTLIPTSKLFDLEKGLAHLNSSYWEQALTLTDVIEYMSSKTKKEWDEQISDNQTPDFEPHIVIPTLKELLVSRDSFLAETVDQIFKSLSGDHVTNQPQGFYKRMILAPLFNSAFCEPSEDAIQAIADLRHIVNKLMGRDSVSTHSTKKVLSKCKYFYGKWLDVDGGAIRLKVFKKGTVHVELHSDMAWRLNQILAFLYPMAIPPKNRKPQKYAKNEVEIKHDLIPADVLAYISDMKYGLTRIKGAQEWDDRRTLSKDTVVFDVYQSDLQKPHIRQKLNEASKILEAIGMVQVDLEGYGGFAFKSDFDFFEVQRELIIRGHMPEKQSHQYYPTQDELGDRVVDWCDIQPEHSKCEPSAGQGHLADKMGADVTCVELSPIHCAILRAKGHEVHQGDFLQWAEKGVKFDRICMNPPFTKSQAETHFYAAVGCLNESGVLVAVLPASLKNTLHVDNATVSYTDEIEGQFKSVGTDVKVILVKVVKQASE